MDGRSRTERYRNLRDEVAESTKQTSNGTNNQTVNTNNTVSTEYDRMLREQEEFLKSLDAQFDSLTRNPNSTVQNTAGTQVSDIQKSVRDFYNQPFEQNLEDTLQTNMRELHRNEPVNGGFSNAQPYPQNQNLYAQSGYSTNQPVQPQAPVQPQYNYAYNQPQTAAFPQYNNPQPAPVQQPVNPQQTYSQPVYPQPQQPVYNQPQAPVQQPVYSQPQQPVYTQPQAPVQQSVYTQPEPVQQSVYTQPIPEINVMSVKEPNSVQQSVTSAVQPETPVINVKVTEAPVTDIPKINIADVSKQNIAPVTDVVRDEEPVQTIEIPVINETTAAKPSFDEVWQRVKDTNTDLNVSTPTESISVVTDNSAPEVRQPVYVQEFPKVSSVFGPTDGIVNAGYNPNENKPEEQTFSVVSDNPVPTVFETPTMNVNPIPDLTAAMQPKEFSFDPEYMLDDDTDQEITPAPVTPQQPVQPVIQPTVQQPTVQQPTAPLTEQVKTPEVSESTITFRPTMDEINVTPDVVTPVVSDAASVVTPAAPITPQPQPAPEKASVFAQQPENNTFTLDEPVAQTAVQPEQQPEPVAAPAPAVSQPAPAATEKNEGFTDVDDLLADLPDVFDEYNQPYGFNDTNGDDVFEDNYDKIISEFKKSNIDSGLRNTEDTQANVISELNKDQFAQAPVEQDDHKSFFDNMFTEDSDSFAFDQAGFEPISDPFTQNETFNTNEPFTSNDPFASTDPFAFQTEPTNTVSDSFVENLKEPQTDSLRLEINEPQQNDFVLDENTQPEVTVRPETQPQTVVNEDNSTVNELTQQLESEREARQQMYDQTQQLKMQVSEQETELNEMNTSVSKTNKILNIILTLLIIALFIILIVIVFFFAQERGLI